MNRWLLTKEIPEEKVHQWNQGASSQLQTINYKAELAEKI